MKKLPPITGETADLVTLLGDDRQGSDLPEADRVRMTQRYEALMATHEHINQTNIAALAALRARRMNKSSRR